MNGSHLNQVSMKQVFWHYGVFLGKETITIVNYGSTFVTSDVWNLF